MAELVDAHVSGACAARRAGSIPVLGTIPIEDSAGGVIHFTPPVFLFMQVWGAIIVAHPTKQGERFHKPKEKLYICTMNTQGLLALAQLILPSEILSNFEVVRVEEESAHLTNLGEPSQCFCPFRVGRAKVGRNVRQIVQGKPFCAFWQRYFWGIEGISLLKRCNNSQKVLSLQSL